MGSQSEQALRMIKFVAELRKNHYPNAGSFSELLRKADCNENVPCACSKRTVLRIIKTLQKDYNAPLEYDATQRGFYLKNQDWEFICPIIVDDIFDMTLLGTRLASDFLPEPLKGELDHAVEKALTSNKSEFFDEAMVESLLCSTGIKAAVDPAVFKWVFDGWRRHQMLVLTYRKPNGEESERKFEPHIIAFHQGIWYTKGYECGTREMKVYAIQRITRAVFGRDSFETDRQLVEKTRRTGLFEYPKLDGVRLRCDASIGFYLYEHQKMKKFKIDAQEDGSLIVTLRPSFEHEVIRWVLGERGHIEVLYPEELRRKVAEAAAKILQRNS